MIIQLIYINTKYLHLNYVSVPAREKLSHIIYCNTVVNILGHHPVIFILLNNLIFLKK